MKNKIKKYSLLSTGVVATATSVGIPVSTNTSDNPNTNEVNVNLNNDGSIVINDQSYSNIEDAVDAYLRTNLSQKQYLGDVDAATVKGDIPLVDLSKLVETKGLEIRRAYKTSNGEYTSNLLDAKRSHLNNPVIKYRDNMGNDFDTKQEAIKSMATDIETYSSEIVYYEILDHTQQDKYGRPKLYRINPLNAEDQQTLKEIAIRNAFIANQETDFSLNRYVVGNSGNYSASVFNGKTDHEIAVISQNIIDTIIDLVRDNIWINTKIDVNPYSSYRYLYYGVSWRSSGYNDKTGSTLPEILDDTEYLVNKVNYGEKYKLTHPAYETNDFMKPYAKIAPIDAETTLFGGQRYSFTLHDDLVPKNDIQESIKWNIHHGIGFEVRGKNFKNDIRYNFDFNQNKYKELMNSNTTFANNRKRVAEDVRKTVEQYLINELSKYAPLDQKGHNLISTIGAAVYNTILNDILSGKNIKVNDVTDTWQVSNALKTLDSIIYNEISSRVGSFLSTPLSEFLRSKTQTNERIGSSEIIYTIDYNDKPLYLFDETKVFSNFFETEAFRVDPLNTLRQNLAKDLQSDYTTAVRRISNGLLNISNSVFLNNTNFNGFSRNAVDNYNNEKRTVQFDFDTKANSGWFNQNVKPFDESIYAKNGISEADVTKTLNRREEENDDLLVSQYGTFTAIEAYNDNLNKVLNVKSPTSSLIQSVNENAISDPNEIVVLFEKDGSLSKTRYGRFVDYGYKFNPSISNDNVRIIDSLESLYYEFEVEKIAEPKKVYKFYDYTGKLVNEDVITAINGDYNFSIEQSWQNALNKVQVPPSLEYVFYIDENGKERLISSRISNLYILNIPGSNLNNSNQYGFTSIKDVRDYTRDYLQATISNESANNPIVNNNPIQMSGFYIALGAIILAEVVVASIIFAKKRKKSKPIANININR